MSLNKEDLAWAAGFIDGEGSVSVCKNGKKYKRLSLAVAQAGNKEPLDKLHSIFGGYIGGPYKQKNKNHTPYFVWSITNFRVIQEIYEKLKPYLMVKAHAFEDGISEIYAYKKEIVKNGARAGAVYRKY